MSNILIFHEKADFEEILGKKGHKIFRFTEKGPALECFQGQKLDLAIVDMNPDGLDLMATLRQSYPDCRTMGVSGSPSLAAVRQAISLGTQEIVLEPFEASELETRVARVLKTTKRNLKEALAL